MPQNFFATDYTDKHGFFCLLKVFILHVFIRENLCNSWLIFCNPWQNTSEKSYPQWHKKCVKITLKNLLFKVQIRAYFGIFATYKNIWKITTI